MKRSSKRLDELVRSANRLDDTMLAALGDSVAKQALFEEIVHMEAHPSVPARRKRGLRLAIAAAGLAAVAIALTVALIPRGETQPPAALPNGPSGDVFGPVMSCVERYSEQSVAARAFAFDGTVTAIGQPSQLGELSDPYVPVTFQIFEWYRGGEAVSVTVAMFPPGAVTTVGNAEYQIGSRLLVSGEPRFGGAPLNDPVAWACGFTRWHTEADAAAWKRAFG